MFIKKIKGSCTFHFCKTYIGLYGESLSRNRKLKPAKMEVHLYCYRFV